jgi:hypothetical protein
MMEAATLLVLALCDVLLGFYLLHRLALWLEARGQLYYLHRKPEPGARGAFIAMQEIIEPNVKHVFQIKAERRLTQQEPGATPDQET